jgi:hypothetical protein
MSRQVKPVVGYEGLYEVTDQGDVWSLRRGHPLKPQLCYHDRYYQVSLHKEGRLKTYYVHTLVLEAFRGSRPDGHEACHGLGGSLDNRLENLRWDTRCENRLDTTRHGNNHNANKTHCKRGHELSGHNLVTQRRTRKDGSVYLGRKCRLCIYASPSRKLYR